MLKFFQYFKEFHKGYFNIWMYLSCLAFISVLIILNYSFPGGNFEDDFVDKFAGKNLRCIFFALTHMLAYYGCLIIIWLFRRKQDKIFKKGFWLKSTLVFILLGIDRAAFFYYELKEIVPYQTLTFYFKAAANISSLFTLLIPLFLFKYWFDRNEKFGLYGLRFKKVNFTPYWVLLGCMVPVLWLGISLIPELQDYYPVYRRAGGLRFAQYYNISQLTSKAIFESFYVCDFIFTELFFRGVLILGFAKLLGRNCVLPMAATYAALHFGKPMMETISSIFGGYILGVIALYSRNIWGGVFIHGGIALLMDIFGMIKMNN